MSVSDRVPCEWLPWDTDFFRCRIARVCGDTLKPEQAAEIDDWSRSHRIQCLYFLSRADDPLTIQTAEQHGFALVDIRITFERVLMRSPELARPNLPVGVSIRPSQAGDQTGLQAIAGTAHTATRFFNDSHFPHQRVEDLYAVWIALEVQGRAQTVLVAASTANQPLGYVSCHLDAAQRKGTIGLVGVDAENRGKGIGKNLVLAAADWFRARETREVTVVTQGNNLAAQRLYQHCNFLSQNLQLWYHKWYPRCD